MFKCPPKSNDILQESPCHFILASTKLSIFSNMVVKQYPLVLISIYFLILKKPFHMHILPFALLILFLKVFKKFF